jgi:hypothetical protein
VAAVTDEALMAYADGMLTAGERASVEAILKQDADARDRLEVFTRTRIIDVFDQPMREPVPQHLEDLVMGSAPSQALPASLRGAAPARAGVVTGATSRLRDLLASLVPGGPAAAVGAASLAIAVSLGWWLSAGGPGTGGIFVADGVLQRALETMPSLVTAQALDKEKPATVTVQLSFRDGSRAFCRQYQMLTPAGEAFSGVGCRTSQGRWQVQAHVPVSPPKTATPGTKPASVRAAIEVEQIVKAALETLGPDEEREALAKGWR